MQMNVFLMTMIYSSFHRQEMKAEEVSLGHTQVLLCILVIQMHPVTDFPNKSSTEEWDSRVVFLCSFHEIRHILKG